MAIQQLLTPNKLDQIDKGYTETVSNAELNMITAVESCWCAQRVD